MKKNNDCASTGKFNEPARKTLTTAHKWSIGKLCKVICISLILYSSFFTFHSLYAQQPWNYSSLKEAHFDDAYFVEPPAALKAKMAQYTDKLEIFYNRRYRLSAQYRANGRNSLLFQCDSVSFSLPESLVTELFPYLVSERYWRDRYRQLQEWAFVNMDNGYMIDVDTADHRYGHFSPVTWLGYQYQPSTEWPVVFTIRTNNHALQILTLPVLQRLAEWGAFTTDAGMQAYEQKLEQQRVKELTRQRELQQHLDSLDRVSEQFARQADSITVVLQRDSLAFAEERLMAEVQATKERMNRDQIFLMSVNTARSDYMFGLEFNFYNCFQKVISKIEITVAPVNDRGQVQKDQFNRDVRTVRCMGPVQPGSPAQYTFDELFWDDKGRIKYMRVTSVIFHFPDGTRKSFYGYERIMKHTLNP